MKNLRFIRLLLSSQLPIIILEKYLARDSIEGKINYFVKNATTQGHAAR